MFEVPRQTEDYFIYIGRLTNMTEYRQLRNAEYISFDRKEKEKIIIWLQENGLFIGLTTSNSISSYRDVTILSNYRLDLDIKKTESDYFYLNLRVSLSKRVKAVDPHRSWVIKCDGLAGLKKFLDQI